VPRLRRSSCAAPGIARRGRGRGFEYRYPDGERIEDAEALEVVGELKRRRSGTQLLAYRENGRFSELRAENVNDYIKRRSGGEFTAKDFRTWNATVLAAVALAADAEHPSTRAARERKVRAAVKTVATYLGNTPAVAHASRRRCSTCWQTPAGRPASVRRACSLWRAWSCWRASRMRRARQCVSSVRRLWRVWPVCAAVPGEPAARTGSRL
jgi:DNA topoisomerase IB